MKRLNESLWKEKSKVSEAVLLLGITIYFQLYICTDPRNRSSKRGAIKIVNEGQ